MISFNNYGGFFMETITKQKVPVFGYEIIRDHVLSNILGKHENEILYWAGKDSDIIFVMDKGKIVEQGCHAELLKNKSLYYELVMNEMKDHHSLIYQ